MPDRLSRAQVLAGLSALAAAAALPLPGASQTPPGRRLVDVHFHHYPPQLRAAQSEYNTKHGIPQIGGPVGAWTPARAIEEMDRTGIATAILSLASLNGVWFDVPVPMRRTLSRTSNEYAAQMMRDYPGRFGLFAAVPLPDVQPALAEAAYALDTLKADGISVQTSWGDKWPGDPMFDPFWQEMDRRKAVVVFHPLAPACCTAVAPPVPESYLEYPYDTGRAVMSLLFNGTLHKYRNIRWVIPHAGGPVPLFSGRIRVLSQFLSRNLNQVAPDGVDAELKRLYYDTANSFTAPAMSALLAYVAPEQVLFGTDYPYVSGPANADGLDALKLPPATMAAIQRGNAVKLLPRLA